MLVVEDDASLRFLCRLNLELEGFLVLEASTVADARTGLAEGPDVVLLDLHVGGELSHPLLEEAKLLPRPPADLLFTGTAEVDSELRARADGSVPKPFEPEELVAAVRRAVRD